MDGKLNRMDEGGGHRAWHPMVFAAYPPLLLYSQNMGEVGIARVLPWMAASLSVAVLVWAAVWFVFRARQRAALAASLATGLMFSYGPLTSFRAWLDSAFPLNSGRVEAVVLIAALLGGYGFYRALRNPAFLNAATRFLNVSSLVLAALLAGSIATHAARIQSALPAANDADAAPVEVSADATRPDIYLILLDAYAGEDTLRDLYGFDNSAFLDALDGLGFHVQPLARSNYIDTVASVASLLNLEYALGDEHGAPIQWSKRPEEVAALTQRIRNSVVVNTLQRAGYYVTLFESGYEITEIPGVDAVLRPDRTLREFDFTLLNQTVLAPVLWRSADARGQMLGYQARARVRFIFDELKQLPDRAEPQFVFAHVPCPHRPLVFRADGSPRMPETENELEDIFIDAYVEQLRYVNERTLEAVAAIRNRNPDAVVIVQGDHGPKYIAAPREYDWHDYTREYLATLNAVYLPDGGYDALPATFSQVNTFRVVFNRYLGTDYEMLPDISYFPSPGKPGEHVSLVWENGRAAARVAHRD